MPTDNDKYSKCYGKLEIVFPLDQNGLRQTPGKCIICELKTSCLSSALNDSDQGLRLKEDLIDRAYQSGMLGFLQRWSSKKDLHRERIKKVKL